MREIHEVPTHAQVVDLATISFPGRTSISFVDGYDTPIALDLCTPVSLVFYLIFIIFSVRQRHGASWALHDEEEIAQC